MSSNLPPGVVEGMIPGNRPEDLEWESFYEWLGDETYAHNLVPEQARLIWSAGFAIYKLLTKANGGKNV